MKIDNNQKNRLKDFLIKKIKEESEGTVVIEAPYALGESEIAHFKTQFPHLHDKHIETKVVPALLGGFIIRHGSTVIDASVNSEVTSLLSKLTS